MEISEQGRGRARKRRKMAVVGERVRRVRGKHMDVHIDKEWMGGRVSGKGGRIDSGTVWVSERPKTWDKREATGW